jgi:hypothetical protein
MPYPHQRVTLLRRRSLRVHAFGLTDASGNYTFPDLDMHSDYIAVCGDQGHLFRATAGGWVTPSSGSPTLGADLNPPVPVTHWLISHDRIGSFVGIRLARQTGIARLSMDRCDHRRIRGTVTIGGSFASQRVAVFDQRSMQVLDVQLTDPQTGAYDFRGLHPDYPYVVICDDHTNNLDVAVADNVAADEIISFTQPVSGAKCPVHVVRAKIGVAQGVRKLDYVPRHFDAVKAGHAVITGTVKVMGQPARRRVYLLDRRSAKVVGITWSNDAGQYDFVGLNPNLPYIVVCDDYTQTYNAGVADWVSPEG